MYSGPARIDDNAKRKALSTYLSNRGSQHGLRVKDLSDLELNLTPTTPAALMFEQKMSHRVPREAKTRGFLRGNDPPKSDTRMVRGSQPLDTSNGEVETQRRETATNAREATDGTGYAAGIK